MCLLYTKFCDNWSSTFCVILLTNEKTKQKPNANKMITSFAEIITDIQVNRSNLLRTIKK